MKNLLEQNFISHYGLHTGITVDVVTTTDAEFELKDDAQLVHPSGQGIAKYKNKNQKEVSVINYEMCLKALPQPFQQNKENCDLIVYTSDKTYFFLNELTDTNPVYIYPYTNTKGHRPGKEQKARNQLRQTIEILIKVPAISQYINLCTMKYCCFFNKQTYTPQSINALQAFNKLNSQMTNGFNLSDSDIESFGFEFWVYSGNQTCSL
jgi:hypothetical protein